ncbi:MAG: hypothetical protein RL616_1627, partial [Verrucomicrobiota bacterium]
MKIKLLILLLLLGGGAFWFFKAKPPMAMPVAAAADRKILFYQSSMHPWIKSDKPGKCPICGMDLVPVYEGDARASTDTNMVVLRSDSITAINVQTEAVAKRPIIRTLHVIGD